MNRTEIRETIDTNLKNGGIVDADIRVQADPFGGWQIAVVADGFKGKGPDERRKLALEGLQSLQIEWLDLLTSAEKEWAGDLPLDAELDQLPLWPEALARGSQDPLQEDVLFASDLDEDLPRPLVVSFPHPQTRVGTRALVRALLASKTRRQLEGKRLTPDIRFLVSPVPSSKAHEIVTRYRHRALEWIAEWLSPANDRGDGPTILEDEVTHFVTYRETLASSEAILADSEVWRDFEPVAQWVDRFLPTELEERASINIRAEKEGILNELRFGAGTAEQQADFLETFVETDLVKKAIDQSVALVLGRKGTGKTAQFRRLSEDPGTQAVVVQAPASFRRRYPWLLGPDGFQQIGEILAQSQLPWPQFWSFYTTFAVLQALQTENTEIVPEPLREVFSGTPVSELDIVNRFEETLKQPRSGLVFGDILNKTNRLFADATFVLFDGLDTGFGSTEQGRRLREQAISGLFSFWMDKEALLDRFKFKILLRKDIWRKLRFENKSHLFGRAVTLTWKDQAPFFKVVLKQAMRSPAFSELAQHSLKAMGVSGLMLDMDRLDMMSDDQVFAVWNVLGGALHSSRDLSPCLGYDPKGAGVVSWHLYESDHPVESVSLQQRTGFYDEPKASFMDERSRLTAFAVPSRGRRGLQVIRFGDQVSY